MYQYSGENSVFQKFTLGENARVESNQAKKIITIRQVNDCHHTSSIDAIDYA